MSKAAESASGIQFHSTIYLPSAIESELSSQARKTFASKVLFYNSSIQLFICMRKIVSFPLSEDK